MWPAVFAGAAAIVPVPLRRLARAETGGTDFFTDLYIDANDTYFDAGRLYRTLRDSIADSAPLVGAFLPEWSLPNYITQAQLAKILGVPNTQVAMQEMSGYTMTLSRQCVVHPDYAKKDYTYYQFPYEGEDAAVLVVGLPLKSLLFDDTIPVDVHVEIPAHGVNAALSGTLKAGVNSLSAPVSVISDSDIDSIVQLPGASGAVCRSHQHSVKACAVTKKQSRAAFELHGSYLFQRLCSMCSWIHLPPSPLPTALL